MHLGWIKVGSILQLKQINNNQHDRWITSDNITYCLLFEYSDNDHETHARKPNNLLAVSMHVL